MLLSIALKERINELMDLNNIDNPHELSLKSGISYTTVNDFFKEETKLLRLDKIVFICEAFNISLKEFFDSDLFKDVECEE